MSPRTCDRPTGVLVPGELRRGEKLIYGWCVEEAGESTDTATDADTSVISADDLIDAYRGLELTAEEEYAEALDAEVRWDLEPDGTITRATDDPTRGRAWGRDQGCAWSL